MIDIDYLKQLLDAFDSSSAAEIRIDVEGTSIRLSKRGEKGDAGSTVTIPTHFLQAPSQPVAAHHATTPAAPSEPVAASGGGSTASSTSAAAEASTTYHEIRSPIVGTFYRSPSPDAPPFVEVGTRISPGTVLCIVEAMKLMNEIESDVSGVVAQILVENGQPVEYNQLLFLVSQE